ncbi:MAG: WxcM-like domain-containing protein [Synergistaceae bacterium]|nr:WxcM-like domain-containing protein [Synergistaceae bacterium]
MTLKERCPILHFSDLGDERGKLVVIEGSEAIPFDIKRVFYIYDSDETVIRGQHANRESEFVLINVAGKSKIRITDGKEEMLVELDKPMTGVYIPKMIWKDMYEFSPDSVLLVLASTHYDGNEYIRDYNQYLSEISDSSLKPVLSLCMPTNGVPEWAFPSLESIYAQGIDENIFEVVIMDNGNNHEFRQRLSETYESAHSNLHYYHTDKPLFLSEPESYKKARGKLIKFVNHRNIMKEGSIQYFIDYAERYGHERPVTYFSNGVTRQGYEKLEYSSFGSFLEELGYFSTWSGGMSIWKTDMDTMRSYEDFNFLFPHTDILFSRRKDDRYIIDGSHLWDELPQGQKPKGNYNLFYAFAVEFLHILLQLLRDGDLSTEEFLSIKRQNLNFLSSLYEMYIVRKEYCCYDLTDYEKNLEIFYSKKEVVMNYKKGAIRNMITLFRNRTVSRIRKILMGGGGYTSEAIICVLIEFENLQPSYSLNEYDERCCA